MRIQHNIPAMSAYRNYTNNTKSLSKNLEKLSSGYRINRAGDDAAGLAISEKMRAQITGLKTASKNVKDGISMVQTAEGAMQEVHDMLNRMVELAEQSANGTYDSTTDRANIQKEVDALRSEINRIADSANFNGIKLLDGSLSKTEGISTNISADNIASEMAGALGTLSNDKDGKLTAEVAGTAYTEKFYLADFTNDTGNAISDMKLTYKDASGASKDLTVTIAKGGKFTINDFIAAVKNPGTASGDITVADGGTALAADTAKAGYAKDGKFNELYDISADGNVITITAKGHAEGTVSGNESLGKLQESKIASAAFTKGTASGSASLQAAEAKLKDQAGAATNVAFGASTGEKIADSKVTPGSYTEGQIDLTISGTGKDNHNRTLKVGDKTFIIKSGTNELKNKPSGAIEVAVKDDDAAADVAKKLAQAITGNSSGSNGFDATAAGAVVTIRETENRGLGILNGTVNNGKETDMTDVVKAEDLMKSSGQTAWSGSISFVKDKIANGTQLTVGGKTYTLTSDPNATVTSTTIKYNKDDTNAQIAEKVAAQLNTDFKAVNNNQDKFVASNGTINFSKAVIDNAGNLRASGTGMTLQIGDTADSFNQMNVRVGDMHTNSLGLDKVDVSEQKPASEAIDIIKNAINQVSSVRGDLGAAQNRLEHTSNNLSVMTENIQDAESTIRDVDVAEEMMAYTKNNILVQSAQAMLAQANQLPQGVLQLLQ